MEFAAPIDADEEAVARIELEIDPRAAIRNDAAGIQKTSARMGLALVVIEEHAG